MCTGQISTFETRTYKYQFMLYTISSVLVTCSNLPKIMQVVTNVSAKCSQMTDSDLTIQANHLCLLKYKQDLLFLYFTRKNTQILLALFLEQNKSQNTSLFYSLPLAAYAPICALLCYEPMSVHRFLLAFFCAVRQILCCMSKKRRTH